MARALVSAAWWHGRCSSPTEPEVTADQTRSTLGDNELLSGHDGVVDRLAHIGRVVTFKKGERLTEQDGQDEDVFFLLRGSVDIRVGRRQCDSREAPQVVGELAASSPGKLRTATVVAASASVTALRINGQTYRDVLQDYPKIRERHQKRVDEIMRQNTASLDDRSSTDRGISWPFLSGGVGAAAAVLVGMYAWTSGWDWPHIILVSAGSGLAAFIFMITLSVRLMIGSLIVAAAAAIVAMFVPFSWSGSASIDPDVMPWLNFSVAWGHQGGEAEKAVGAPILLILIGVLVWVYRKLPS